MDPLQNDRVTAIWKQLVAAAFAVAIGWGQVAYGAESLLLEVKQFVVEGENPLSDQETQAILAPHLGKHKSLTTLEAAAIALENALRDKGFAFHRVIVPAQRPVAGEVKLRILQFPLAQVSVAGNQHFSNENVLNSLPALEAGKPPQVKELARQLSLANEHPAKRLTVNIKESQEPDHLDAEVRVRDVPSMQTFVALNGGTRDVDNTINQNTGYTRLTIGHQQSNLFDRDHALTLAYTTSPEYVSRVMQLGAFYWLPLYGYHTSLAAYWTKSDVDTGTVGLGGQSFDVSGRGEFSGLRATYALPKFGVVNQHVSLALDDRFFRSDVAFEGTPVQSTPVGSRPLSLRYLARAEHLQGGIGGYVEYLTNIGGGRANDDVSYNNARQGAAKNWDAFRYGLEATYSPGGGWSLIGRFRGQYADEALIPGEQFGLGGVGSVRGLRDRETTGDKGYSINFEAHAPGLAWGVAPFVFYDAGNRRHLIQVTGIPASDNASSIGFGARWSWQRNLEVNAAFALVLNGVSLGISPATTEGHTKLHFSVFYRF